MSRRTTGIVAGLALVASVLAVAPTVVGVRPAGADGFNFLCEAPGDGGGGGGGGGGSSEFEQLATGLVTKILGDQAGWVFTARVPAGIPVTAPGAVTDPGTGETTFTMLINPKLGFSQKLDFIDGDVVPGADGDEIRFGYAFRTLAGQRADDLSMLQLFRENYGLPPDPGTNDIGVLGVDIEFETNEIMGQLEGFHGDFGALFTVEMESGATQAAGGNFRIHSDGPGYRIPEEATLSLAIRRPPDSTASYTAFGQRAIHDEFDGLANQPGVGFGLDLSRIEPGFVEDPYVSMSLGWDAAPRSMALGIGSLCPDKGHLAWSHDGMPDPGAGALDVDVAFGIEEGLPIEVDEGSGPEARLANEMDVVGRIDGVPSKMDVIMQRDALSFTRSPDVAPDLAMTRLAMADDDPADPEALPLYATAEATDIPRHLLLTVDRAPDATIERGEITSWTLACPDEPVPPDPAAPDELRRLDLPGTLPSFPVGCTRHSLTPVPMVQAVVQSWLPEDLLGQAAAAGLATAPLGSNQFGYFATRKVHSLSTNALVAYGGRINGLQRATFDFTEAPVDGERARVYVERVPEPAADDSIRVVGDVDGRTSADEAANTGARFTTAATITDLPDRIRLDYQSTPTTPLDLTWRADAPVAVVDGSLDAQLRGPDALTIHGAFETGDVGAGALPPAARLEVTEDADGSGGAVRWTQPGPVTDTFPTPTVPAFDPSTLTVVHAGAQISTLDERTAGIGTRVHGRLQVPQPVDVTWDTGADDQLESFVANFCDPAAPAACVGARLDGTAVRGPQTPLTPAELLTAPALPAPSAEIAAAGAPFTDFRPLGSGVRGILLADDLWGVDAVVGGITRAEFHRDPTDVVVQLADTAPQPFRINLLDASGTKLVDGVERPQVLSADALIDRLPSQIRVRYDDSDPDEPIVWVNTEDLGITDLADVDFDATDPPGTRPLVTGVIRLGDASVLGLVMPVGSRPTPPRDGTTHGVDLWAEVDTASGLFGIDAATAIDLPRHVAVWEPRTTECGVDQPPVDECQGHPVYDIDETTAVDVLVKTTSETFGDLVLNAGITGQANLQVRGSIANVGGQLEGAVKIAENRRLPWRTVNANLATNAAMEDVRVEVLDRDYDLDRDASNGNQPPAYRGPAGTTSETTNYGISLTGVPRGIDVVGRLQSTEPRLHGLPGEPPSTDPCSPKRDDEVPGPDLGFVHAELDLGLYDDDEIAALSVDAREIDGNFAARLTSDTPIAGFVNGLVEQVRVVINADCDPVTGVDQFLVTGAGILLIGIGAAIGSIAGPIGAVVGGIVGGIVGALLDLFSDAEVTLAIDLDVDLPVFLEFDDTTDIRAGLAGLTLSADEHSVAGDPATIGFRQQSMSHEMPFSADGAFFNSRSTAYIGDDIPGIGEDWNASNTLSNELADVALLPWHDCNSYDTDDPCATNGGTNVVEIDDFPATPRDDGYASTDLLLDMFFDAGNRDHLADEDGGLADPGKEIYSGLADAGAPFEVGAFDFGALPVPPVAAEAATFTFTSVCCSDVTFVNPTSSPPTETTQDFGAVCAPSTGQGLFDGPRARGTDGTEYVVALVGNQEVSPGSPRAFCEDTKFVLQASLPQVEPTLADERLGPPRWSAAIPVPDGLEAGGECHAEVVGTEEPFDQAGVRCEVTVTVTPQVDGSVQVVSETTAVENGVDGASLDFDLFAFSPNDRLASFLCCPEADEREGDGSDVLDARRAWLDSSGHPGFFEADAALVADFTATTSGVTVGGAGDVTLDPCAMATWACDPARGADERTRWVFGDGVVSDSIAGVPGVVEHRYPTTDGSDQFLGILVRLGPGCEETETDSPAIGTDCRVLDKTYFRVDS